MRLIACFIELTAFIQVRMQKCSEDEFYNDDMASNLKINHLEMTFQPVFGALPTVNLYPWETIPELLSTVGAKVPRAKPAPPLGLELLGKRARPAHEPARPRVRFDPPVEWDPHSDPFAEWEPRTDPGVEWEPRADSGVEWDPRPDPGVEWEPRTDPVAEWEPRPDPVAEWDPMEAAERDSRPESSGRLESSVERASLAATAAEPAVESSIEPGIEPAADALLPGLGAPLPKKPRGGRGKKAADGREPVDGMILTPGSDPLPCRVELL